MIVDQLSARGVVIAGASAATEPISINTISRAAKASWST